MHILATETEEQAVYFGQLIYPSYSVLPPSHRECSKNKQVIYFCRKQTIFNLSDIYTV